MRPIVARWLALGLFVSSFARAGGDELPWTEPGSLPLPLDAKSAEIGMPDAAIRAFPSDRADRRGSAIQGTRLPVFGAQRGPGCIRRWILVGPTAWVCGDHVALTRSAPIAASESHPVNANGTPFDYYFVGPDGSFGYAKLRLAEEGIPDAQLDQGFAVAVLQVARKAAGDPFGLTTKGLWMPMRDLVPASPANFGGVHLDESAPDPAWALDDQTRIYEKPSGANLSSKRLLRWSRLGVLETTNRGGRQWLKISEDEWVRARDVRRLRRAEPPDGLLPRERWIDIDLEQQVLTAYAGKVAVFATLVSTGRGRGNDPSATPKGVHRIWVKLRTSDMTNLENEEASRYYAMQEVPWVMYFKKGYGLHGAYWHRSFGRVRSHGCVNLTPRDAKWLFDWTGPKLPAGWSAVLPTGYDRGTLVRVR